MDPKIITTWRDKLTHLLERARAVAQTGSLDARRAIADELHAFAMESPGSLPDEPETAEFDEMNKIARMFRDKLRLSAIDDSLANILGRTVELARLTGKIQGQTEANAQAARSIRLEKARKVILATTDAVAAIKELKAQVEAQTGADEDVAALGEKLGKALETLQEVRTAVQTVG